jgi:hypothetical protein
MIDCFEKIYIKMLQMQLLREPAIPPEEVAGDHHLQHEALLRPELQLRYHSRG